MRFIFLLLCATAFSVSAQDQKVSFTSSNLPVVVINTNGGTIVDDPKIGASMGIIDNGTERNSVTDPFNDFSGKIGIEIRGSSSQMFPKKQYGIELRDDTGKGLSASLLGLPEEEDWVLFAPYNDKSLMRDALAYNLGRQLTGYTPRTRYCEVVVNDVYQGVYVLIEKIKRDKNRLDINKLDPDEVTGNNLTGGYIIKIDKTTGGTGEGWTSEYKPPLANQQTIYFQYEYPDASDIVPQQSAYIHSYVNSFEAALSAENFSDPISGYTQYADIDSFIDYLIIQELTRNVDGYRLSAFMYKKRDSDGGKLHMGPIWDFNLAFGNADYCSGGDAEGWALDFNSVCPTDNWLVPFWWKRLFRDESFGSRVAARWAELRADKFSNNRILSKVDSMNVLLNEAQARNFTAWKVLGKYVWPNLYVGKSFAEEVTYLRSWIEQRLAWMDSNLPGLITAVPETTNDVVSAFPNPFKEFVDIQYNLDQHAAVSVKVYDALGKSVTQRDLGSVSPGQHNFRWDTAQTPAGFYYYQVNGDSRILGSGKFWKQ
ncbi:CotH kinase family protein [Chryseolinea sp. T2]|uniref:CotH kinase family protein n=1 Tax=Chryseolinea sp. T2 TaxID=3129255 RepID=UPI0030776CE3